MLTNQYVVLVVVLSLSSLSSLLMCTLLGEDTSTTYTYCQIDDIAVVTSVDNNDELSYFYYPSLPRVPLGELCEAVHAHG